MHAASPGKTNVRDVCKVLITMFLPVLLAIPRICSAGRLYTGSSARTATVTAHRINRAASRQHAWHRCALHSVARRSMDNRLREGAA
jgi:hypothetical protein